MKTVHPEGWAPPRGYANGALCDVGRTLYVAGQIAWNAAGEIVSDDFVEQLDQCLANVIAVVTAAGGKNTDVVKMTVYATDLDAYRGSLQAIGLRWRDRFGAHFPAMALVGVSGLVDPRAKVEIEAIAHFPSQP